MNAPDLKKLITTFLSFAIVASSLTFVFSAFTPTLSSPYDIPHEEKVVAQGSALGSTAFVEALPPSSFASRAEGAESDDGLPPIKNTSNLTENVASVLAREFVVANPGGPAEIEGELTLLPPSAKNLDQLLRTSASRLSPRFFESRISAEEITILSNYRENDKERYLRDVSNYRTSFLKVWEEAIGSEEFRNLREKGPGLASAKATADILDRAIRDMRKIPVPLTLAKLHENSLLYLANQRKIAEAALDYQNDPAKFLIVAKAAPLITDRDFKNLEREFEKVKTVFENFENEKNNAPLSLFINIFGIAKVRAQGSVPTDCVPGVSPSCFADILKKWLQILKEWAAKLATETLKNQTIHRLVQQTVEWIKGGGKPQFVTNWKRFLKDSFNEAAGIAALEVYPQLCSQFSAVIRAALLPPPTIANPVTCTLSQITGNFGAFMKDFQKGGWIAYGGTMRPANNVFSALFSTRSIIERKAKEAEESGKSDAESSGGFLSTKICVKRSTNFIGPLRPGELPPCLEWQTTTPGQALGQATYKALGSPVEQIVNVQDFQDLVSALVDSFLNKLITAGVNGITGALNTRTTTVKQPAEICTGLSGQALLDCLNAANLSSEPVDVQPTASTSTSPTACPSTAIPVCSEFSGSAFTDCLVKCSY